MVPLLPFSLFCFPSMLLLGRAEVSNMYVCVFFSSISPFFSLSLFLSAGKKKRKSAVLYINFARVGGERGFIAWR
jgi:hypothetical protein